MYALAPLVGAVRLAVAERLAMASHDQTCADVMSSVTSVADVSPVNDVLRPVEVKLTEVAAFDSVTRQMSSTFVMMSLKFGSQAVKPVQRRRFDVPAAACTLAAPAVVPEALFGLSQPTVSGNEQELTNHSTV